MSICLRNQIELSNVVDRLEEKTICAIVGPCEKWKEGFELTHLYPFDVNNENPGHETLRNSGFKIIFFCPEIADFEIWNKVHIALDMFSNVVILFFRICGDFDALFTGLWKNILKQRK